MDNAVPYVRKQDEYNAFIQGADLIFCVFYEKVGSYTKEEFNTALERFKQIGSPKIFTYFYEMSDNNYSQDIKNMMEELDKKHHHFYSIYNHIDMIKLAILLQVTMFFDKLIIIEDNQVCVEQYKCMTLTKIPAFSKNKNLQKRNQELDSLRESYQEKVKLFESDVTNIELARDVSKLAQAIDKLTEEIRSIEKILGTILRICIEKFGQEIYRRCRRKYTIAWKVAIFQKPIFI